MWILFGISLLLAVVGGLGLGVSLIEMTRLARAAMATRPENGAQARQQTDRHFALMGHARWWGILLGLGMAGLLLARVQMCRPVG